MVQSIEGFKNTEKLTRWVGYFLYIQIAVALVSIVTGNMEYQLLSDYQHGVYTSQEKAVTDGETSDQRQQIVAIIYTLVFIVAGILILKWIYHANYNARQLGARDMEFTPGWSIGWYFVPIATLWKPYQAMKEIWRASHSPSDWRNASTSSILPWWWFIWLTNNFLGQAVLRMSLGAKELDELINANLVYQASDIVSIPLALVTLALVNNIYAAQINHTNTSVPDHMGVRTKHCPECAKEIKLEALLCRFCGYAFDKKEVSEEKARLEDQMFNERKHHTLIKAKKDLESKIKSARRTGRFLVIFSSVVIIPSLFSLPSTIILIIISTPFLIYGFKLIKDSNSSAEEISRYDVQSKN